MIFCRNILPVIILYFYSLSSYAQIAVTNNPPYDSEESLVTDVLLGDGIDASNFSSVGFANGIGYFDGNASNIGFAEGIILSTGGLEFVTNGFGGGSAISGDADLELALNAINLFWGVNNVTILEFDFVAESESVAFNYIFGSSEYSNYTCTQYNDIFGFFLSGPGIVGPYSNNGINLAYIPDPNSPGDYTTTPVAVNTVNSGSPTGGGVAQTCSDIDPNWVDYSVFWVDNSLQPSVQGINGFTVPFTAEYNGLICGETYHIKLAIADASDSALNSVVFLEANSFASPEVQISSVPNAELGLVLDVDNGVLEGCGQAAIIFDRAGDMTMDLDITLEYSGEAQYGLDYDNLPTELTLPAFQEQVVLPIDVFYDNITEGQETLLVTVSGVPVPCEDDLVIQTIELILFDQEELLVDVPDQISVACLGSTNIEASIQGGYPPYNYVWSDEFGNVVSQDILNEEGSISIESFPDANTFYNLIVSDDCLDQIVTLQTDVLVEDETLSVLLEDDIVVCEDEFQNVSFSPTITGGLLPYQYTWFYNGEVISNNLNLASLPGEGLYQLVVQEACGAISGDEITVSFVQLAPYVEITSNDVLNPNLLPESCFQSILLFNLQEPQDEDIIVDFTLGGTAELGIDYYISSTEIIIPAGEETVELPISIIEDNELEGLENIEFNFPFIDICSNWPDQIVVQIYEPPNLNVQVDSELVLCEDNTNSSVLEGFVSGGVGIVNYAWYFNNEIISTDLDISTENLEQGIYSLIATDQCGNEHQSDINYIIIPLSPTVELFSLDYEYSSQMNEGCGVSTLLFEMPYPYEQDTVFYFDIITSSGFVNGLDVQFINNFVEVEAGQTSVQLDIVPILDLENEIQESVVFSFPFITDCVEQSDIEVYLNDYQPLSSNVPASQVICVGDILQLAGELNSDVGLSPYNMSWTYNGITESITDSNQNSYVAIFEVVEGQNLAIFEVYDDCGLSILDTVFVEGVGSGPTVELLSSDYDIPSQMNEGCGISTLLFEMPYAFSEDTIFYFDISSSFSFSNGGDVQLINDYIEVPAGQLELEIDIVPLFDYINESEESIIFSFPFACSNQEDIEVFLEDYQPLVCNVPDNFTICSGDEFDLEAQFEGGLEPYIMSWSYNGLTESNNTASFIAQSGENPAVFTVQDDCGVLVSKEVIIEGFGVENFEVISPPNQIFACYGDNSQLDVVVEGGVPPLSYQWFVNGIVTSSPGFGLPIWNEDNWNPDASHTVATITPYTPYVYNYEVLVIDACLDTIQHNIEVTVEQCTLPTAFSPNQDGNNDVFWVEFGDMVGPVSLDVFNRWGALVYRSEDYTPCIDYKSGCWDGTHYQLYGEKCSAGVYYYVFTYSIPIKNIDEYNVSGLVEGVFGGPHNRSLGRQRTGHVTIFR